MLQYSIIENNDYELHNMHTVHENKNKKALNKSSKE
jgi:hypothetical protein